jgi:short-subunit dehydrogenase
VTPPDLHGAEPVAEIPAAQPQSNRRLVFITGASGGIGQALARHYARAGWHLALVVRDAPAQRDWLSGLGLGQERAQVYVADMREVDSVIAVARDCLAAQGLPELVIASAGISVGMDSTDRADLEVMRETFEVNCLATAATFHAFIEPMRAAGAGTLVGIASVAAVRGLPGHGAYCASKSAVVAYCESLRCELSPLGVRVLTLLPGYVDTPMTHNNRYRMPFLMAPEVFAARAARAIGQGKRHSIIPWQMAGLAMLLRLMPGWLFERVMARRGRKNRR